MKSKFVLFIALALGAIIVVACASNDSKLTTQANKSSIGAPTVYADGARRVTIAELETLLKNNEAVIIDVRNQAAFDEGHIPGSKLIPAGEILTHLDELPRDKLIITYCS
jgi:3-mercaptopyruvate sulfurtransferase SseA